MGTRLFIGHLNFRTTEEGLAQYIGTVAPIATKKNRDGIEIVDHNGDPVPAVFIVKDRDFNPPRSKGFGFVEMADAAGAQKVIDQLDGKEFEGLTLRISEAQERPERPGFQRREERPAMPAAPAAPVAPAMPEETAVEEAPAAEMPVEETPLEMPAEPASEEAEAGE